MKKNELIGNVEPNYKVEYERHTKEIFELKTENENLKSYVFTLLDIIQKEKK